MNDADMIAQVRQLCRLSTGHGPTDAQIIGGVNGFVSAFDYWYIRVLRDAVKKYRSLIVGRINPFIRRVELAGLGSHEAASRLVEDYTRRNFVTAGGWALEELAIAGSATLQKSAAEGIDAQRLDVATNAYHLYVLKSGTVTRNSDIVRAIKTHGRQAEKLLRQGRGTAGVHLNYAVLAGKTSSTFEDGVRRPSSGEFWSEVFGIPELDAIEYALAMAAVAGGMVKSDAGVHVGALEILVGSYIATRPDPRQVDWEFVAKRNLQEKRKWAAEDRDRHRSAWQVLLESGYTPAGHSAGDEDDD